MEMEYDIGVESIGEAMEVILQLVEESVAPERVRMVKALAKAMLRRAPGDFFRGRTDADIVELVKRLYGLLETTPPDEISVRVTQRSGYGHAGTAEIVVTDRPFVVDTLRQYLTSKGFEIRAELHPIVVIDRDEGGGIVDIRDWAADGQRYAVPYCEFEGHLDEAVVARVEAELKECMEDVRLATDDFQAMLERADLVAAYLAELGGRLPQRREEVEEMIAFLDWLKDEGFVFLGYRGYDFYEAQDGRTMVSVKEGSGLGILRREQQSSVREPTPLEDFPADLRARALLGPLLIVSKANSESRVHRRARLDYIGIKKVDEQGEVVGEHRFLGLFTWKAYSEYSGNIPILRRKLWRILDAENLPKGSHDYRAFIQLFNDMPKEELFLIAVEDLRRQIREIMAAEDTGEVRLLITPDVLGRGAIVVVVLPKRNYSDEVRGRLRHEVSEALAGSVLNDHLALGEGETARLHFYVSTTPERLQDIDVEALRRHVATIVRTWKQRLRGALGDRHGAEDVHRLEETYFDAFTPEYVATVDVDTAVHDIERLEALQRTGLMQVALEEYDEGDLDATQLRLFVRRGTMILADTMPMLENLGLRAIEAAALDLEVSGKAVATIHNFVVQGPDGKPLDRQRVGTLLSDTLLAVHTRQADNDRFNRLVIMAGLRWHEIGVLRAYASYAFQVGAVPSRRAAPDALIGHPEVARLLFEVFRVRFDPDFSGNRSAAVGAATNRFMDSLQAVEGITDDLTLRRLHNLIDATVRTSYFRNLRRQPGVHRTTFKFDCAAIQHMPPPRPAREMFVHSPLTSGAHLRFGPVARGGIRWSERPDDFRTEVLGLVKTQQVKNSVIVPSGAKGAFYIRRPPANRAQIETAVRECYREFIAGLLDVTDNIVDGDIVHPPHTLIYDDDDPYLVVAADKGTAAYSDLANETAGEYGFWLGDAFASGGSHGYDHKKEGITARGAWECVRRHFREFEKDIMREPVTAIGIGDMSGDVFGNGMLLSRTFRLVAAFDHRHIFIDPDPDPERSYEERRRLFDLPRSSWADYDTSVISTGGGIYPRGAKEIRLSPEARTLLQVEEPTMNGQALIQAILKLPVDLLWNGGIGTYVKATTETNADVGDSSNDAVRINATELGSKVVGEGGNLGLTQLARIEYALEGGRLNTDAVDNSGGVDMSDHEVNLKILLAGPVERGDLSVEERNELLEAVTGSVSKMVLSNNKSQSRALSLEEHRAVDRLGDFRDTSYYLEQRAGLKRSLEFLPGWGRLQARQEQGKALTRPELAVLLAYSKMHLKREILSSTLPDDPALLKLLRDYFPRPIVERIDVADIRAHRLQREIIATVLTNRLVDLMGSTFIPTVSRDTGASPASVARGWYVAVEIAGAMELLEEIERNEDRLPTRQEYRWLLALEEVLDRTVRWAVENLPEEGQIGGAIERFKRPVAELSRILPTILVGSQRATFEQSVDELKAGGVPSRVAQRLAALRFLGELMEVTRISKERDSSISAVGRVYFELTRDIDFGVLHEMLKMAPGEDVWEQRAAQLLVQDLGQTHRNLTLAVLAADGKSAEVDERLVAFRRRHEDRLLAMRQMLEQLLANDDIGLPALTVATHELLRHSSLVLRAENRAAPSA